MARLTVVKVLLVAVGFLAGTVLASPQNGRPDRPGRPVSLPRDPPGLGGPWRSWDPVAPPSPTPLPPEPAQPPIVEPPPTLTPAPLQPPADEGNPGSSDVDIDDGTPVTGTDETPTDPVIVPGSSPTDENADTDTTDGSNPPSSTTDGTANMDTSASDDGPGSDNRTLVISLSTVLSVVALFLIIATLFACYRVKHGRLPFAARGISPIDDEEIESWKRRAEDEKFTAAPSVRRVPDSAASSPGSLKKSPSVIVYQSASSPSAAEDSAGSVHNNSHSHSHSHAHTLSNGSIKRSLDLPQTPVLARAPNSRPGLTDETVEGDEAFIPTHKRQYSRLSKKHSRSRSSSSYQWPSATSPRQSSEYLARASYSYERARDGQQQHPYDVGSQERGRERKHARIYSDSSMPPRTSFDDDVLAGGLSPRPLLRGSVPTPESEIGRAIG